MRIVLLSPGHPEYDSYPDGGGIQHQVLGVARELARSRHDVHVICRDLKRGFLPDDGIKFHQISVALRDQILSVLAFSKHASALIEDLEPDVVSAYERFSAFYPSKQGFPLAFTTQNYDAFRYYRKFSIGYNPLNVFVHPWKQQLEERIMKRAWRVIALTASIEEYLKSISIQHVEVIPNGISSTEYSDLGDDGYILYAGRLDAPKRVEDLIRAYAAIREFHGEFHLVVVGKGPSRRSLMKLAADLEIARRVRFVDWVPRDQLAAYMGRCSALVLPSEFETFGIVLLEAMACAKPVIASRIPGPRDIIEDGQDGLLFDSKSVSALSNVLRHVLEDRALRRSLGQRARKKVHRVFDFARVASRYERVFELASSIAGTIRPGS